MKQINFFCINLDSQHDRWADCQKQFSEQWIPVKRWSAKPLSENRRFGAGLSHREIIEHAKNQNWEYVCVFEDDLRFIAKDVLIYTQNALSELKSKKWYILYLGGCMRRNGWLYKEKWLKHVLRVKRCVQAHAIIYHRRFFDIYLKKHPRKYTSEIKENYLDNQYRTFDVWLADVIQYIYPCYITNKMLAVQKDGFSIIEWKLVIRNKIAQYRFLAYKYLWTKIVKYLDTFLRPIKNIL